MTTIHKKKILIIDDEKKYGEVLKLCLEKFDFYEATSCTSGHEGLERLAKEKFDLIILDILMPKMEGHEVLERVRKICNTPVIILSAFLPPLVENQIIQLGAFACLRKPVDIEQIILTIHKALSNGQAVPSKVLPH